MLQYGGHGDKILARAHDWALPWYVNYHTPERIYFNPGFRAPVGTVNIPAHLQQWAAAKNVGNLILLEPRVKGAFSSNNKAWAWDRWQAVARMRADFAQCAPAAPFLDNVRRIITPTFQRACAILAQARGIVTTSGGLHIAAAALGKPAIVLWGAFSSPENLGYTFQRNFYRPDPEGLGQRKPHPACVAAMERITVAQVIAAIDEVFPC